MLFYIDWLVQWVNGQFQFLFQFVEEVEVIEAFVVQFVDEDDDWCIVYVVYIDQFFSLCFYVFGYIDYYNYVVDCCKCVVGVFLEILVFRGIENVDFEVVVFKGYDGGCY